MLEISGSTSSKEPWSNLIQIAVLVEYDGPKVIVAQNQSGQQFLGLWCESERGGIERWLYVPASRDRFIRLFDEDELVYRVVTRPEDGVVYVVDSEHDNVQSVRMIDPLDLPTPYLPRPDAALGRHPHYIASGLQRLPEFALDTRYPVLDLAFSSPNRPRLSSRQVGLLLTGAQDLITYSANGIRGNNKKRGIPIEKVRKPTELVVADSYVGSVGFRLVPVDGQIDLDSSSLLSQAIHEIFTLIKQESAFGDRADSYTRIGHRGVDHLKRFVSELSSKKIDAHFEFNDVFSKHAALVDIDSRRATSIKDEINRTERDQVEEVTVNGVARAGDIDSRKVIILGDDDERYSCFAPESRVEGLIIGQRYSFTIEHTTTTYRVTGDQAHTYSIAGIELDE